MRKFIVIIASIIAIFLITYYFRTNESENTKYKEYYIGDTIYIDGMKWLVLEDSNELKDYVKIIGIDGIPTAANDYLSIECNNFNLDNTLNEIQNYINALNITTRENTSVRLPNMEELFGLSEYEEKKHNNEYYDLFNDFYFYYIYIEDKTYLREINTLLSDNVSWTNEYNEQIKLLKENIIKNNDTNYFDLVDNKVIYKNIPSICKNWNASYIENDILLISSETNNENIKIQPIIEVMKNSL